MIRPVPDSSGAPEPDQLTEVWGPEARAAALAARRRKAARAPGGVAEKVTRAAGRRAKAEAEEGRAAVERHGKAQVRAAKAREYDRRERAKAAKAAEKANKKPRRVPGATPQPRGGSRPKNRLRRRITYAGRP